MNTYEAKKQLRIERLERAARLSKELSDRLHSTARSMAEFIPFGQPILVGHHSEHGFRWSPSNGCWQAFLNNRADYLIQSITGKAV